MMRTTLDLDDSAVEAAMALSRGKSKTQVINEALRLYSMAKRRKGLLKLRGRIRWDGDLDALRGRR